MSPTPSRPNILFFFTDQQRWDTCGCYGQPLPVTPNLDRMAAEGVRFERALTPQPLCGPARAILQTGLYATEVGCYRNGIPLPLDAQTVARRLSEAGYEVGYIGKWHLASGADANFRDRPVPPERRGGYKDYWLASDVLEFTSHGYDGHMFNADMEKVEFTGYRVDRLTDFAVEYLRTRRGDRPFFLFLSYLEPHHQNDRRRYEGPDGSKERFRDFVVPGDLAGTAGDWRENYPDYLGCCHSLDQGLGRLRAELERLGLADRTVVLYTSDHGSHFCTRNAEYKRSCHEASIRIPMVIAGPGFGGGRVADALVSLLDLPPTILRMAGVPVPREMRGRPLQEVLDGAPPDWRQEVLIQITESQVGRALRTDRWKYGVDAPGEKPRGASSGRYVEQYLYDLASDPHERRNLVKDPGCDAVRAELRGRLKRAMVEAGEAEPVIEPAP